MKVEKNKMVAVDYKLTVDGAIADQSQPGAPLEFICGTGMLLPKFEEAILGKEPGEKVAFTLSPRRLRRGDRRSDRSICLKIHSWWTASWPKTSSSQVRRCR